MSLKKYNEENLNYVRRTFVAIRKKNWPWQPCFSPDQDKCEIFVEDPTNIPTKFQLNM